MFLFSIKFNKKTKYIFIILFFCLFSCNSNTLTKKSTELTVINVYDGDTIELSSGEKLRYLGIDTPELHLNKDNNWVEVNEPFAKEAFEFNKHLVLDKSIKIVFDKVKKDKYGRLLGYVFVDNIFINEEILKEGLAFPYIIQTTGTYNDRLIKAFNEAYTKGKNLYSKKIAIKNIDDYTGKTGWYDGYVRNIVWGEKKIQILTDHLIIETPKRPIKKMNISIGDRIFAYGELGRKKERYILKIKKQSHLFVEKK